MTMDGIAHGKSDDVECSPDPLDANRRVTRGFTSLADTFWMTRVDLRNVERSIAVLRPIG